MFKEYADLMKPREAMEALGIGKNVLYRLLNEGEIKGIRVGGKMWRISKKALKEYVNKTMK